MSQAFIEALEGLFSKKLSLYRDLFSCLETERKCLIDTRVDALWEVLKTKETICGKIKATREEIADTILWGTGVRTSNPSQIMALVPKVSRDRVQEITQSVIRIKDEVDTLRKENRAIIEEALFFLNGITSIVAGLRPSRLTYDADCKMKVSNHHGYLRREV